MDLDADGIPDLISGSWPGELYIFKGLGPGEYGPPEFIKGRDGKPINPGGGIHEGLNRHGEMLLVAGDAKVEQAEDKQIVIYHGERFEVEKDRQIGITGTATAVHAVDWDGDGLIDLLVGEIGGSVYLVPNEGTPESPAFGEPKALDAGGKQLQVNGDAGPYAADWDGDGLIDLLVGAGDGSVVFFRNVGSADAPELAEGRTIVPSVAFFYGADAPKEPTRGTRSKVCVVDWDGDGLLDLLVGDFTYQAPDRPEPSPEEQARHDELRRRLGEVNEKYSSLVDRIYGPEREPDPDLRKALEEEFQGVAETMSEIRSGLPSESEPHGWVWFFRRVAPEAVVGESS